MTTDVYRREAVWGGSRRRTAAPNASEPPSRLVRPGKCAFQHDAQYPTEVGAVVGVGAAGHCSPLPREVSMGPPRSGSVGEGNDACAKPMEKSDHLVVAMKPGNAGGAKGVTG